MSLTVIEFNDAALKVADASGIVLQSPGFALAHDKQLLLGELAEQKARLHPTSSFNKYWHELSLDPLSHNAAVRHHADLAYAHLVHLAESAGIAGEVLFAVPGNFTRQQLGILLGLARQCPFTTVGVVDSALAAAISHVAGGALVYADLQLHQVVLTRLQSDGDRLATETVVQIPGVGSQNVMALLMQQATNAFIQQCRFNPQHNAESEQQLYNALSLLWTEQNANQGSYALELHVGDNAYTAKMPRESLIASLGGHYQKILQQLSALTTAGDTTVLVSSALAALPGLSGTLTRDHSVLVLPPESISTACIDFHEQIRSGEQGIKLVTTLPLRSASAAPGAKAPVISIPTHLLVQHRAIPLDKVRFVNQSPLNGHAAAHTVELDIDGLSPEPGRIVIADKQVYLDSGAQKFLLNDVEVNGRQALALGDRIRFTANGEALTLIQVH